MIVLAAFFTIGLGQGCEPDKGSNGGGYGGLTPRIDGEYIPGQGPPELPGRTEIGFNFVYFRYGIGASCAYSDKLSLVGPYVAGMLGYQGNSIREWRAFRSACDNAGSFFAKESLGITDYNYTSAVHDGDFYIYTPEIPQNAANIKFPRFLCRKITSVPEAYAQEGIDVAIWSQSGDLLSSIVMGSAKDGKYYRYVVDPFKVSESTSNGISVIFSAASFRLVIDQDSQTKEFAGRLQAEINEKPVDIELSCFK